MGVWGPGNFDNDVALDLVGDMVQLATTEIDAFCASKRCVVEDLDTIMACVGAHLALFQQCKASRPDPTVAATLRQKVIRLYDEGIDSLSPQGDYKAARRKVLVATLSGYEDAARQM